MSVIGNQNLLSRATKVASVVQTDNEEYAWISDHELLIWRPVEKRGTVWEKPPFQLVTQFMHTYELVRVAAATGQQTPLSTFNRRFVKALTATPVHMRYVGDDGKESAPREIRYQPPPWNLSPDGEWLLWLSAHRTWIAATLDGGREIRWPGTFGMPHHAVWLPSSHRWIELLSRYNGHEWEIPRLRVHRINEPSIHREIEVQGLSDGLVAGITNRNGLLLRHSNFT